MSKTFYVTGIGQRENFDNVTVILSTRQCLNVIQQLSNAMFEEDGRYHFAINLHGKLDDNAAKPSEKIVAMVK